jgi:hypothetical protein
MPRANRPPRGGKRPGAGRPPGRKTRVTREVSLAAQSYRIEGLEILVEIMRDKKQPAPSRISAVERILDRAYGRVRQAIDLVRKYDPNELSDAELTAIIREEQAYRTGRNGVADERDYIEAPKFDEDFRAEALRRWPNDPTAVQRLLAECDAKAKAALRHRRPSQLRDRLYDLVAVHSY